MQGIEGVEALCRGPRLTEMTDITIQTVYTLEEGMCMKLDDRVIEIIMEHLDVTREECVPEASFIEDLGADSLDLVELIMEMEENFELQISDEELEKIRTIQDVLTFLRSKGIT